MVVGLRGSVFEPPLYLTIALKYHSAENGKAENFSISPDKKTVDNGDPVPSWLDFNTSSKKIVLPLLELAHQAEHSLSYMFLALFINLLQAKPVGR